MKNFKQFLDEGLEAIGLVPDAISRIIKDETRILGQPAGVTLRKVIPSTNYIPIENESAWLRIPDVTACFVDMEGSTKLSATTHDNTTAKAYRYFTNTAVRIFHEFDAAYIDVRGDGVFALFNCDEVHTALAATVCFKTFVAQDFTTRIEKMTGKRIGGHYGIDRKTVLVRKMGLKIVDGRADRQNEVWAGKPINMAAKLASVSTGNAIMVSDRYYSQLSGERALSSCGCQGGVAGHPPSPLWTKVDVTDDDRFDFDIAYTLKSAWCATHGKAYCRSIARYDNQPTLGSISGR